MEQKKEKLLYIQWLRVIAAAAVIIAHTDGQTWGQIPWDSRDWMVLSMYDGLVRWPVLMFLMITGTIFLPRRTGLKSTLTGSISKGRIVLQYSSRDELERLNDLLDRIGECQEF